MLDFSPRNNKPIICFTKNQLAYIGFLSRRICVGRFLKDIFYFFQNMQRPQKATIVI
jgi:hypothetical protein